MDSRAIALYKELTGLEIPDVFGVQIEYKGVVTNARVREINSFLLQIVEGDLKFFIIDTKDVLVWFPDWVEMYDFVYNKLKDLKPFLSDEYPQSVFYGLNKYHIYLEQDNKNDRLWVRYSGFWEVLSKKYSMKYDNIQEVIECMVWKIFKFKALRPDASTKFK